MGPSLFISNHSIYINLYSQLSNRLKHPICESPLSHNLCMSLPVPLRSQCLDLAVYNGTLHCMYGLRRYTNTDACYCTHDSAIYYLWTPSY